jgi:integrase
MTRHVLAGRSDSFTAAYLLTNQRHRLAPRYSALLLARLEADIFPHIGSRPIAEVDAPETLDALRNIEKRGAIETALRLRQLCGQVFRYAVATGRAKHDPSGELRGALKSPGRPRGHKAMPLDELSTFMRALRAYDGELRTRLACGSWFSRLPTPLNCAQLLGVNSKISVGMSRFGASQRNEPK